MSFPFLTSDAGRSNSRRPKEKHDCTVRAIATATATNYDEVYDVLEAAGRLKNDGIHVRTWLATVANKAFGCKFTWKSYPAERGFKRMNPVSFCEEHPRGRYICKTAGHVFAVVDGVVHDTVKTYDERCIYASWRVDRIPE